MRCPAGKGETGWLGEGRSIIASRSRFAVERRPSAVTPRFVLRSEPAAVPFKGKSRAIGGRRLDMGGRGLRRPEGPLVRTPPMLAELPPTPEAARSRRFWSTAPEGPTVEGRSSRGRNRERISP